MQTPFIVRWLFAVVLAIAMTGILTPRAGAAGEYTVTDIGTLVGTGDGQFDSLVNAGPNAINSDGVIVAQGFESGENPWGVGFTSTDGKVKRVGKEKAISNLLDINDNGDLVGWTTNLDDGGLVKTVGTLWRDGETYDMKALGREISQVRAINNEGIAVGDASPADFTLTVGDTDVVQSYPRQAVLWGVDGVVDLGTLGGDYSTAIDINESNQVVGRSNLVDGDNVFYPYLWEAGTMQILETPEGRSGVAYKINDDGIIAGSIVSAEGIPAATRWIDGRVEVLPELLDGAMSRAAAINSTGVIGGWSAQSDSTEAMFATLWDGDEVVDLNSLIPADSGYILRNVSDINDAGQIVVIANHDGDEFMHGVMLNTVDDEAAQVVGAVAAIGPIALRD